jgi:radical SAM protein with 4Fe4S-binding SPASM domain
MNTRRIKKAITRLAYLPKNKYLFLYIVNKIKHFYYKAIKTTKVAYPSTIMLELTNHCNLACTTCPREYDYGKAMDKGTMSTKQAKNVIDELWPYLDSIGLTGMGETFMNNEIEEIVDYIKQKNKGIIISISTNANLPKFIDKASALVNRIDTIQVSIDGIDDVYEQIRKKASFKTLNENLIKLSKLCSDSKTDLMLNMVVTQENYQQMHKIVEFANSIGIRYVDFTLFNLAAVTNLDESYYAFYNSSKFEQALGILEETISKTRNVIVSNRNFKTDNSFQKCPFPWTHFYISWDGFVVPCCAKPFPKELNFGNVFEAKVIDVLNSKSFKNFRTLWFKNSTPSFCNKCHFINIKPVKTGKH